MFIILLLSKILIKLLNITGKGATSLPGKLALKLKPGILFHLSRGVYCICVTGTNGKTTTCAMIEHGLKSNNIPCFINKSGANMLGGVTTAFIKNSNIFGKPKCRYAVLECDENSLPLITNCINAKIIVVTNIFRDQLDRYAEVNTTFEKIKQGILNSPNATVVLNADCPLTYSLKFDCKNEVKTFGVNGNGKNKVASDSPFCPCCGAKLKYKSIMYAQLGDFYCQNCKYKRVTPDLCATDVHGSSFVLENQSINLALGGIYNVYNFLSASSVLNLLHLNYLPLQSFGGSFGRTESFYCDNKNITVMLVKNPVGFSNCLHLAFGQYNDFDSVFALNDNDADGRDVSWIWDVDFTCVSSRKNYTVGKRAYDMALRLKYDGIVPTVIDGEKYQTVINLIKNGNRDFVIFASYTAMMNMRHMLIENFGGDEFWQ